MTDNDDIFEPIKLDTHFELESQLGFMRTLVDSTGDAIIVHEPDGRLLFYNLAAKNLLEVDDAGMRALPPYGWVGTASQKGAAGRLESILHEGKAVFASSIQRATGEVIPTEVHARKLETERGPLVVAVIRDTSERAEAQERLEYLAYHDALTGLSNRAALESRLRIAIADAMRHGDLLILAYVDLDRFKPVNDRFGHDAGDTALIEIGRRLVGGVRIQDVVARLGGDEFVALLQRVESLDEVAGIGDRLHSAICQPIRLGTETVQLGASIGFSIFDPKEDDARSLLVKADMAMYEAKRDPYHAWLVYDPSMGTIER